METPHRAGSTEEGLHRAPGDLIYDPEYAASVARDLFGEQFAAVRGLIQEGRNLLKRLLVTRPPETIADAVICCGLLRQYLVSMDGWLVCAERGAAQAAQAHLRSLVECAFTLEFLLKNDRERLGKRVYIQSLRGQAEVYRRGIPGKPEFERAAWRAGPDPDMEQRCTLELAKVDQLLASEAYREENALFEAFRRKRKREANWYEVGSHPPKSIAGVARSLKREGEYLVIYGPTSMAIHGTATHLHFGLKNKQFSPHAVRMPHELESALHAVFPYALHVMQLLISEYRPEELDGFGKRYLERWKRPSDTIPNIVVQVEQIPLWP